MTNTPAGWYDNPQDTTTIRYWDGQQWTDHLAPRPGPGQANPTQPGYGVPNDGQPVDAQNAYQPGYPDAYGPTTPDGVTYGNRAEAMAALESRMPGRHLSPSPSGRAESAR